MSDHVEGKNDAENGVALESSGGIDIHSKRKFKGRRGADIEPRKKFKGDRYSGDIQDGYRFVDSEPRIRHFPINQNEHYMEEEIAAMDEDGIQEPLKIEESWYCLLRLRSILFDFEYVKSFIKENVSKFSQAFIGPGGRR